MRVEISNDSNVMLKFAVKREQSQACLDYAEPTNETRTEDASHTMPCKEEEDKVNVSKLNKVNLLQDMSAEKDKKGSQ